MKLRILSIGHKMPSWVQTGFQEYLKRILPMMSVEMVELPPAKRSKNPSTADIEKYKQTEAATILAAKHPKEQLWLLEVKGKMLSTETLSDKLSIAMQDGSDIALVIGGADGVANSLLQAADFQWSLSDLTLPHPLVRVILIEQLYRAMSIINNHPYHRGG
ncbi:23S rRNA (pseudouridine1915-N3)-methyltransferase [Moraxella cuniculi DSM 21768]|uniref:Ribosomal RNA large subunit methyltransferase H n=1 Tax=Moraxella cuniculi DSM 21768 TaxID=1122245 RepID=A0A1N7FQY3_9GAMM|nr:23S rRNA (pseudouridine(1915)-N(3))-methyltransferase RlmH [Moraxella cuniculi]OOS08381.1 23S rRNA (pseudouridine(1915)-N(3))-methyltransferase RlmH [Moraxella cuniculi]SIS02782.1 23S rRNA (pseudouridine1915-N3)-methyltransferase [Moraxella cuniculi DSM 21768]